MWSLVHGFFHLVPCFQGSPMLYNVPIFCFLNCILFIHSSFDGPLSGFHVFGYLHRAAGTWHPKAPGEWAPLDHTASPLTLMENPLLAASFLSLSSQGISKECEGEEISLGQFVYNKTGTTVQTFELQVTSAGLGCAWLCPWEGCGGVHLGFHR